MALVPCCNIPSDYEGGSDAEEIIDDDQLRAQVDKLVQHLADDFDLAFQGVTFDEPQTFLDTTGLMDGIPKLAEDQDTNISCMDIETNPSFEVYTCFQYLNKKLRFGNPCPYFHPAPGKYELVRHGFCNSHAVLT